MRVAPVRCKVATERDLLSAGAYALPNLIFASNAETVFMS
jgi:hypothetical protein